MSLTALGRRWSPFPKALSQTPVLHCETTDTGPVYRVVCLLTSQRWSRCQIILLGDRGTTCLRSLPGSVLVQSRTCASELQDYKSDTLPLDYRATVLPIKFRRNRNSPFLARRGVARSKCCNFLSRKLRILTDICKFRTEEIVDAQTWTMSLYFAKMGTLASNFAFFNETFSTRYFSNNLSNCTLP